METQTSFFNLQPLQQCTEKSQLSRRSRWSLPLAHCISLLSLFVPLDIRAGLVASSREIFANTRVFIGLGLMVVGAAAMLLHYFFDSTARDYSWLYINWYYYLYTTRVYILGIFWSLAFFFFTSTKYKLALIPTVIAQGFCWASIIHISLTTSNEEVFAFPHLILIVTGLSIATSFSITMDELVYYWEHKRKGILCRFVGLTEIDFPQDQKAKKYAELANEYRQLNPR